MLSSVISVFKDIPRVLLREHYRCHPKIIGFCNKQFYNNQLILMTKGDFLDDSIVFIKTAPGNHGRSYNNRTYNQRQIDVVFNEVLSNSNLCPPNNSVGIISPYREQTNKIKEVIPQESDVEADTVHRFQGREKDVVVMTTVSNDVNKFIDDPNLINVGVSRAINRLIVIAANEGFEAPTTNIGALIGYIKYHTRDNDILQSNIISVFDILYKEYSKSLLYLVDKIKLDTDLKFNSEKVIRSVMDDVLATAPYTCFTYGFHVSLRDVIKPSNELSETELKFLNNKNSHLDFLIYSKIDMRPFLALEVDGVSMHEQNPNQLRRDALKNSILKKNNFPLLRLKTNQSGEREAIIAKISELLEEIKGVRV